MVLTNKKRQLWEVALLEVSSNTLWIWIVDKKGERSPLTV